MHACMHAFIHIYSSVVSKCLILVAVAGLIWYFRASARIDYQSSTAILLPHTAVVRHHQWPVHLQILHDVFLLLSVGGMYQQHVGIMMQQYPTATICLCWKRATMQEICTQGLCLHLLHRVFSRVRWTRGIGQCQNFFFFFFFFFFFLFKVSTCATPKIRLFL